MVNSTNIDVPLQVNQGTNLACTQPRTKEDKEMPYAGDKGRNQRQSVSYRSKWMETWPCLWKSGD